MSRQLVAVSQAGASWVDVKRSCITGRCILGGCQARCSQRAGQEAVYCLQIRQNLDVTIMPEAHSMGVVRMIYGRGRGAQSSAGSFSVSMGAHLAAARSS